jgi:hypothetical protein
MPHEQYMQTAEGKKSQQAFQQWGQWQQNNMPTPSKPGPGRPSVPMMQANAPGQAQPQQNPYGSSTPYGGKPQSMGPQWNPGGTNQQQTRQQPFQQYMAQGSPYGGGNQSQQQPAIDPNVANNPYANRPPPFQATTQNFDGTQSDMPNFQQRDAFISQINNQLGQMQNQSWQQPGVGAPQFNFPQMLGQADEMAQQGFQNPFAQAGQGLLGTLQQQSTPSMYNPPSMGGQPAMPSPGTAAPGYGDRLANPGGKFTADFRDSDFDGVDDRDQMAPGQQQARPPQQGGISARELGIGQSVIYRQPDGSISHEPPPGYGTGPGVKRWLGDALPPQSPGAAQPIPPQSTGTPPGQTSPNAYAQYQEQIDQLTSQMRGDGADRGSLQRQIDYYKQQQTKARDRGVAKAGYDKEKTEAAAVTAAQKSAAKGPGLPVAPKPKKPPQSPFPPGYGVALPPGMQGTQWERLADGSYAPAGSGKWQTPRKAPRVINWGAMTPDQIASTPSPYLGGRIPTVKTY